MKNKLKIVLLLSLIHLKILLQSNQAFCTSPTIESSRLELTPSEGLHSNTPNSIITPIEININNKAQISDDKIEKLKSTVTKAVSFFREATGETTNPINIHIGTGTDKLNTGYALNINSIVFVEDNDIINMGLDSVDVINHEVFHALLCGKKPDLCQTLSTIQAKERALHEAFADFFAYQLNQDSCMGENYYRNKSCVRSYSTDLIFSLIDGPNVKDIIGNIIVSNLVKSENNGIHLKEVWQFILAFGMSLDQLSHLSPSLSQELETTQSYAFTDDAQTNTGCDKLRRCRFANGVTYQMIFQANDTLLKDHPDLQIIWVSGNDNSKPPQGFSITPHENNQFTFNITIQDGAKIEKAVAGFVSGGKVIGYRTFHFSRKLKP